MTVLVFALHGCGGGGSSGDGGGYYGGDGGGSTVLIPNVTTVTNNQSGTTIASGQDCNINGSNFGSTRSLKYNSQSKVTFMPNTAGGTSVDASVYSYWSDTYIRCTTPTLVNGINYIVVVTIVDSSGTPSSSSNTSSQGNTITATTTATPAITSISPTTTAIGTSITISGSNFGTSQGSGYVLFGLPIGGTVQSSVAYWSNTTVTCVVPTTVSPGSVPVSIVTGASQTSNSSSITIVSATSPYLTVITPTSVMQGSSIVINGANLGSTAGRVNFGSVQQTVTTSWSSTGVTCVVPTTVPTGAVSVSVTTSDGTTTNAVTLNVGTVSAGKIYALFVGINAYPTSPLNYCVNDSNGMQANLVPSTLWSSAQIYTLADAQATKSGIQGAIATIAGQLAAGDTFFFYYSGHGSNSGGVSYLVPVDSDGFTTSCISATELSNWVGVMNTSAKKVIAFDSCYSGGFIGKGLTSKFMPIKGSQTVFTGIGFDKQMETVTNMVFLAASAGSETSIETSALQHGVFTYYLMNGLGTGATLGAAASGSSVSAVGLFNYASPQTTTYYDSQHPQVQNNYGGDLVIKQ